MRVQSRIAFHMEIKRAQEYLLPLGLPIDTGDTLQVIELFTDTNEYKLLLRQFKEHFVEFSEEYTNVYSKEDLATSEALCMLPNSYCGFPEPRGEVTYKEISYDLSSKCMECGNVKNQIHPIRMLKPKIGKNDICAIYWIDEFIVTARLKNLLEKEKVSGVDFWSVINHKKNTEWVDIYQLKVNNILPSMCQEAIGPSSVRPCSCGTKGYMLKDIPIYNSSLLNHMSDFNLTREHLGASHHTGPYFIISKKIYNIFTENEIKGVKFVPVKITD